MKQSLHEPKCENSQNNEPSGFIEQKAISLETPFTREEIIVLLDKVEDYMLDARNIRLPTSRYDMFVKELLNFKYNRKMFSLAQIWLKKGKFPVSKTTLELSDFFPDRKTLEQFTDDIVSREYHIKAINSLRTDFEIEKKKLEIEYFQKYSNNDAVQYESEYRRLVIQSKDKEILSELKIDKLQRKVDSLQKEIEYLHKRIMRNKSSDVDETRSI